MCSWYIYAYTWRRCCIQDEKVVVVLRIQCVTLSLSLLQHHIIIAAPIIRMELQLRSKVDLYFEKNDPAGTDDNDGSYLNQFYHKDDHTKADQKGLNHELALFCGCSMCIQCSRILYRCVVRIVAKYCLWHWYFTVVESNKTRSATWIDKIVSINAHDDERNKVFDDGKYAVDPCHDTECLCKLAWCLGTTH